MMQKNPYAEAPIQKQPQQKPADPFQESNLEEFGDITFDSMVFPAYKDLTDSHVTSIDSSSLKKRNLEVSETSSAEKNSSRETSIATSTM